MKSGKSLTKDISKNLTNLKSKANQVSSINSKKSQNNCQKMTSYNDLYDDVEAQLSVTERAERVVSNLNNEFPHFVKCMLPSNVAQGFWLYPPKKFCDIHFPNHDTPIVLVDDWENKYITMYLSHRHGLSAGWRSFAISHRLLRGDILIFHMIEPCKFKVHIERVNNKDVIDAAICLMNLESSARGRDTDLVKRGRKRIKTKFVDPFTTPPKKVERKSATNSVLAPVALPSTSNSGGLSPGVLQGV